jgi:hypothetical protein
MLRAFAFALGGLPRVGGLCVEMAGVNCPVQEE